MAFDVRTKRVYLTQAGIGLTRLRKSSYRRVVIHGKKVPEKIRPVVLQNKREEKILSKAPKKPVLFLHFLIIRGRNQKARGLTYI